MAQYSWSEIFYSVEGEGPYTGTPTIYARFTGCNMTCSKFNNPEGVDATSEAVLQFNPKDYTSIYDIPVISKGCDSQYSWNRDFAHMWNTGDTDDIVGNIVALLPQGTWSHPVTGQPTIFSLTGGEPMLVSKKLPELLDHPLMEECRVILIETNASVPMHPSFVDYITEWVNNPYYRRTVIFSNSPKLSSSGEPRKKAINPACIMPQIHINNSVRGYGEVVQYFKFVAGSSADFDEVDEVMSVYYDAGVVQPEAKVYLMPMACTASQQEDIAPMIAELCMKRGYSFCVRLQNILWGNGVGT